MIVGFIVGLMVVGAAALFIGGIAVGAWLEHNDAKSRRNP